MILPRVIGHRGAAASAPENTLAGFRRAAALGVTWVEFDVKLTADKVPVLVHDDSLKRTTGRDVPLSDVPFDDLGAFDAGAWFSADFAGEPIPSLEQALMLFLELGQHPNIEIKPSPGQETATVERTLAVLERLWPADKPAPLISSFAIESLEALQRLAPALPRGFLFETLPSDWAQTSTRLGFATIHHNSETVTAAQVAETKAAGYGLVVHTVNEPERARELVSWGIEAVITDAPERIMPALDRA